MADVNYTEDQTLSSTTEQQSASGLLNLVIRLGLASDAAGAQKALLILVGGLVLVALSIPFFFGPKEVPIVPVDVTKNI